MVVPIANPIVSSELFSMKPLGENSSMSVFVGLLVVVAGVWGYYDLLTNVDDYSFRKSVVLASAMICILNAWLLFYLERHHPKMPLGIFVGLLVAFVMGPILCFSAPSRGEYFAWWFIIVVPFFGGGVGGIVSLICCVRRKKREGIKHPDNKELLTTAWEELDDEERRSTSTWAKAFTQANGDEARAKAVYVRLRVKELSQARSQSEN
jgi:hypothetical protein